MDDETNNWALEKIMMPDAWDYTRGSAAITVGIIDSGIDASHPNLDASGPPDPWLMKTDKELL